MIETAFVFDNRGCAIHWHEPPGRSGAHIPDDRGLWEVMWNNRSNLGGVAHTHPWSGRPSPSHTDVTTFAACEKALGKRLVWPIVTFDCVIYFSWSDEKRRYVETPHGVRLRSQDIERLRYLSGDPDADEFDSIEKIRDAIDDAPYVWAGRICDQVSIDGVRHLLERALKRGETPLLCIGLSDSSRKDMPFQPDWTSPPGDTIQDCLEQRGMSLSELSERLGLTFDPRLLNDLLQGRAAITPHLAGKLARILGGSKHFWLNREALYRHDLVRLAGQEEYDTHIASSDCESDGHACESVTTADGHGAYCRICGETLA